MILGKYFVIIAVCLLTGTASALIARYKGHYAARWFFLGAFFNIFAVIGALTLQRAVQKNKSASRQARAEMEEEEHESY